MEWQGHTDMSSIGGDSPRAFDVADSQADMDWLHHQPDHKAEELDKQNRYVTSETTYVDLTVNSISPKVKQEHVEEQRFDWTKMPRYIDISDCEDERGEDVVIQGHSSAGANATSHSQPPQDSDAIPVSDYGAHEVHEETTGSNDIILEVNQVDIRSDHTLLTGTPKGNLGKSIIRTPNSKAKRSAADIATMKELQAKFRAKALDRANGTTGADAGASALLNEEDSSAKDPAMNTTNDIQDNEGGASTYQRGNNESEDTLFLPQRESPTRKRPLVAIIETDEGDHDVQEVDGSTVPDRRLKRKRQQRPHLTSEQILQNEASDSLATALQQFTTSLNKGNNEHKPIDPCQSANKKGKKEISGSKAKTKSQKKRNNRNDSRAQTFVAGLQPHDVLAEANANLDRDALPSFEERDKQKYLTALLQSVPKDDRPGVRGERSRLYKAATSFGHGVVKPTDSGWRFKGMKSQLLHHQLLGASFMRKREMGSDQPYGGLLADEMGFGKTVMMIVTIVTNPPQASEKHRSTLIVCSPALILQWKRELAVHASDNIFKKVLVYSGASRLEGEGYESVLEEADVVLTTYGQVMRSYPLDSPPDHLETAEEKREWAEKHWSDKRGLLHRSHFHRVVLDEAQAIKNHKAHTSLACQAIMARYRWAISGTPIMNRLEELYPYFKFLRVQYTGSFQDFRKNFCGIGNPYTDRLQACLQAFMLRRTHKDLIFGKPIIKLPECHPKTINLRPTKIEVAIYRAVEMRYIQAVNAAAKSISEEHLKRLVMAMLTRLRQMTAHLFLVQHIMQDIFEMDDLKRLWAMVKDEAPSRETLIAITGLIDNKEDDEQLEAEPPTEAYTQPSEALLRGFQTYLRSLITNLDTAEFSKRSTCSRCGAPPENPYLTSCMHVYCYDCLLVVAKQAGEKGEQGACCLECGTLYTSAMPCVGVKELNYDVGTGFGEATDMGGKTRKRHKPPKDLLKWIRKDGGTLPSTKSAAVVEQIEQWLTEEPDKKIIVFSQWHMMMQIMIQDCVKNRWGYCTYHGAMTNKQRDKSIADFAANPDIKVMVASLKCGGLGLNLTMASKIICVDLWFNSYIEQQAFCRIFRIGQESETYINRYVLKGTVDERLVALQESKKKLIGRALGDTEAFKHFSAEDLMRLFGTVRYDENSRPFIVVEDENNEVEGAGAGADDVVEEE
ncbi:MAG: hypothetical protein Q9216_003938 [Gyalolechia sp. 2 TL-2023]